MTEIDSGGYRTEASYVARFHRALNPRRMALAISANGFAAPDCDEPYTYMEMGFGQGVSLVMLAAANPHAEFYGVDLLPEHVAHAQSLADAAGLANLHLFQLSFADLHLRDWPDFDFVVQHGVWTWIAAPLRAAIRQFIDARLKPGGVAYVSYNAKPGWAAMEPLRALMKLEYDRAPGALPDKVKAAVGAARALEQAQSLYFRSNPTLDARLKQLETGDAAYLAHEYFNAAWRPFYVSDVAAEFAAIGLEFVGSGTLHDNVVDVTIRPQARPLYAEMRTAIDRETLKDVMTNKHFRRDLYMRGARRLDGEALDAALGATRFAALMPVAALSDVNLTTETAAIKLNGPIHQALVAALGRGPASLGEVHRAPDFAGLPLNTLYGTAFLLAAMNAIDAAARPDRAAAARQKCMRLNAAIAARAATPDTLPALASPVIGAGVDVAAPEQTAPPQDPGRAAILNMLGVAPDR